MTLQRSLGRPLGRPLGGSVPVDIVAQVAALSTVLYDGARSAAYQDYSATTLAGVGDPIGFLRDIAGNAQATQISSSRRPLRQADGWTFDGADDRLLGFARSTLEANSATTMPDLADSTPTKGFTCTGLARNASDGTIWVVNEGRTNAADSTWRPSLVHLPAPPWAGTPLPLAEIDLLALYPAIGSCQGGAHDDTDDSLWVCSTDENLIRHVGADGSDLGSFASTSPNGIAINTDTNELIVVRGNGAGTIYDKVGVAQGTFSLGDSCDQIFWRAGLLFYTGEAEGTYVQVFDLASQQYVHRWELPEADSIEGLVLYGTTMLIANDSSFHGGASGLNQVLTYTAPNVTYEPQTKITLFGTFSLPAAPVGSRAVLSVQSGVAGAGAGIWALGGSTTSLRIFANSASGTGERSLVDFTGLPDLTVPRQLVTEIDMTAQTVEMWVDGAQYGGTKTIGNVTGGISTGLVILAGAQFNADEAAGAFGAAGLASTFLSAAGRETLDTYLASRT
jgi:hypothetical protein